MAEIIGYKYNPENTTDDNVGVYQDVCVLDVSSMHPSMWMSKKDIRKVRRSIFWWDVRHFYHIFTIKRRLKEWQRNIVKGRS